MGPPVACVAAVLEFAGEYVAESSIETSARLVAVPVSWWAGPRVAVVIVWVRVVPLGAVALAGSCRWAYRRLGLGIVFSQRQCALGGRVIRCHAQGAYSALLSPVPQYCGGHEGGVQFCPPHF